jgi:predicted nucleotidyltransferase
MVPAMALTVKEMSVIRQFKASVEHVLGRRLIELKIFGSKARGDDRPDSDIDLLVIVATDDWHIRDKVYDVATDILLQMDVCISPKVISKNMFDRLCKESTSFMCNVSKDAITV